MVTQEVIRMLGFNAERPQRGFREVFEIERHDDIGPAPDRRRQDVAIVRVG